MSAAASGIQGKPSRSRPAASASNRSPIQATSPGRGSSRRRLCGRGSSSVPQGDPAERDPAQEPSGAQAGEACRPLALVRQGRSRPGVERRRALGIGELGERVETPVVDEDLPLPPEAGRHVEGHRRRPAQPPHEADVGPEDPARFAHTPTTLVSVSKPEARRKSLTGKGNDQG